MCLTSRVNLRYKTLQKTNLSVQFRVSRIKVTITSGVAGVLGTWRNQFGSCFAIQFMVVVSVLDLMALFRSWTFFWQNGLGEDINFARLQILAK